jgi:competence protein ComEA
MKKILVALLLMFSFASALNLQKASKDELMCIKGIGEKKASAIMKYRKSHKLKSAKDLLEIKGFGEALVDNVKRGTKSVACGGKKSSKKSTKKSVNKKKSTDKKSSTKKKDTKKSSKKSNSKKDTKKKSSKKESKK